MEEQLQAVKKFLSSSAESSVVSNFCSKYRELMNEEKEVILVGHSLGSFAIIECSMRFGKVFKSFLFSPYTPSATSKITNHSRNESSFKKILFAEDWLANNLLSLPYFYLN